MRTIITALIVATLTACGGGDPSPEEQEQEACAHPPYSQECPPPVRDYPTVPCPSQYDPNQLCQVHPAAPNTQPVNCTEKDCH